MRPAYSGCEELCLYVLEGFELQSVARRIEEKKRSLLAGGILKANMGLDHELHLMLFEPPSECIPLVHFQHYAAVRHRHAVAVYRVEVRIDPPFPSQLGIEMANELMPVEIEIDPRGVASPLRTPYDLTVESSCLSEVSYLDRNVKWGQLHNSLLVYAAGGPRLYRRTGSPIQCTV